MVRMIRETVRSEMEMPSIFSSPWIRGARQSGLAAAIRSINRRISMAVAGRPGRQRCARDSRRPESAKSFPLPVRDSVGLDVEQRATPTGPPLAESDPEYAIEGHQQRSLPFSVEGCELDS